MKIESLKITNFRAIKCLEMSKLSDLVTIAGTNGCGKSSIFNAIRLLKSAYGEYHQNEWRSWFSEFQIDVSRITQEANSVLGDPTKPLSVAASFGLANAEVEFLKKHGRELIRSGNWSRVTKQRGRGPDIDYDFVTPQDQSQFGEQIREQTENSYVKFVEALEQENFDAALYMYPSGEINISHSPVMEVVLSCYRPRQIGIIDYHGSQRVYGRQKLSSINLQGNLNQEVNAQHALYNTDGKYGNIKTQMAGEFIHQLLARESGAPQPESDLMNSLSELFREFFPGKEFVGAVPQSDGRLEFPVRLANGTTHDIDDLSSGEKEVLLGYLRLRNSGPVNSVLLIDEPELHLNPKMIHGLVGFYRRNLGPCLGNQIWLITHSDALIRDAIAEPNSSCFHMKAVQQVAGEENQLVPIVARADAESVVIDLVGDLATYSPRSKVVILEGAGDIEFDLRMTALLFPELEEKVTLISGQSKSRVRQLHELLDRVADVALDVTFYSVVDRDFDLDDAEDLPRFKRFTWDVYHIENYLLDLSCLTESVNALTLRDYTESQMLDLMHESASELLDNVIEQQMVRFVGNELHHSLVTKPIPGNEPVHMQFAKAASVSSERIKTKVERDLSAESLAKKVREYRIGFEESLSGSDWLKTFPGRPILKRLTAKIGNGMKYELLRNSVLNTMKKNERRPDGMRQVIERIINDKVSDMA